MMYNDFQKIFSDVFNASFPLNSLRLNSTKKFKQNQPWMTPSLIKCCRKKSRLLKNKMKFPNAINKYKYKNYKNVLKTCIRSAERNYYQTQFEQKI